MKNLKISKKIATKKVKNSGIETEKSEKGKHKKNIERTIHHKFSSSKNTGNISPKTTYPKETRPLKIEKKSCFEKLRNSGKFSSSQDSVTTEKVLATHFKKHLLIFQDILDLSKASNYRLKSRHQTVKRLRI